MAEINYLPATWPAPANVRALTTTRINGYSLPPFDKGNLAMHVNDDSQAVEKNREILKKTLQLKNEPFWLEQTHSTKVAMLNHANLKKEFIDADASITQEKNLPCVVLTADCLPILITNQQGTEIAAIHAGWRGLLNGIIDETIAKLHSSPKDLLVWFGPAIGPNAFDVGEEVRAAFMQRHQDYQAAFTGNNHQWKANIFELAKINLLQHHIEKVYGGEHCTYSQPEIFYSHRYSKGKTGRMASLIWMI